jgi:thiol:disulfide interchange protein/DsbC/DsbD-like thiol-disulfide interchange protein
VHSPHRFVRAVLPHFEFAVSFRIVRLLSSTPHRIVAALWCVIALALATAELGAQRRPPLDPSPHSDVVLVSAAAGAQAGRTVSVAVRLTLDDGWHTYWTNPGDAGLPLKVSWQLPAGVTAGPLQFPTPHLTPQPPLMSYGYERELFALADLTIGAEVAVGTELTLAGKAEWLACADVCLPAAGDLSLTLPVVAGTTSQSTKWSEAIAATRAQLPQASIGWRVQSWTTTTGYTLSIIPPSGVAAQLQSPYIFVDSAGIVEHPQPQRIARTGDTVFIGLTRALHPVGTPSSLRGILSADVTAASQRGWMFDASILAKPSAALAKRAAQLLADSTAQLTGGVTDAPVAVSADAPLPNPTANMSLFAAIAFAFIGGLILNLMPCVFPVLSVKVLSLIEHAGESDKARARKHGLAFGVGVLLSFWILAGILLALRAGGQQLGWGFQLQSPPVVALLALLMFALGLNLSGVFEIGLSLTRLGSAGAGRGYSDSLLTGVLAVLVAAPCTAPFMGAALGYALVQPAVIGMLVFTALGAGLALPFVILTGAPQLLRFLPRSGPWLETLKQAFAFPLYATVVWLLWVLGQQAGIDAVAMVLLAMIVLAIGAWMWNRGVRLDRLRTRVGAAVFIFVAVAGTLYAATRPTARETVASAASPDWEPWSAERVRELRSDGRAVFIDFTAAWCLSCQVNERIALNTDAVRRAFRAGNVALLRADWTSRDSAITNVLASFGRSGVPLYVLYPAGKGGTAVILPAVLSPRLVVSALREAAPPIIAASDSIR